VTVESMNVLISSELGMQYWELCNAQSAGFYLVWLGTITFYHIIYIIARYQWSQVAWRRRRAATCHSVTMWRLAVTWLASGSQPVTNTPAKCHWSWYDWHIVLLHLLSIYTNCVNCHQSSGGWPFIYTWVQYHD